MRQHQIIEPSFCPWKPANPLAPGAEFHERNCPVCEQGLGICLICFKAEIELDEPCIQGPMKLKLPKPAH